MATCLNSLVESVVTYPMRIPYARAVVVLVVVVVVISARAVEAVLLLVVVLSS